MRNVHDHMSFRDLHRYSKSKNVIALIYDDREKNALNENKICEKTRDVNSANENDIDMNTTKKKMIDRMNENEKKHLIRESSKKLFIDLSEHEKHEIHENDMNDIAVVSLSKLMNDFDQRVFDFTTQIQNELKEKIKRKSLNQLMN